MTNFKGVLERIVILQYTVFADFEFNPFVLWQADNEKKKKNEAAYVRIFVQPA